MQDLLNIGEIGKRFNISKQTLQYYDKIGLFQPAFRDANGYRRYHIGQFTKLAYILNLKKLGLSLEEIEEIYAKLTPHSYLENLDKRKQEIQEEIDMLEEMKATIERKEKFLHMKSTEKLDKQEIIKHFPERYYVEIGTESELYKNSIFYHNPTVVFYLPEGKKFGCYLYGEKNREKLLKIYQDIEIIPAGDYLSAIFKGSYEEIFDYVKEIRKKFNHLNLEDTSIHFNIIDQFVECDTSNFITEINIRVLES